MNMIAKMLKTALAALHYGVIHVRNVLYDRGYLRSYAVDLPVICIGNAVMGGSGKSPMTQYVARELRRRGLRPAILLRGYRGTYQGVREVLPDSHPNEVGDEAVMHAQLLSPDCRIVVARDRVAGCQFISEFNLGDIIILDDGYQHRRLQRSVNLLLVPRQIGVSLEQALEEESMFPLGTLREPYSSALKRADVIVSLFRGKPESEAKPALVERYQGATAHLSFETRFGGWRNIETGAIFASQDLPRQRIAAVCGVAHPEHFFSMIEREKISTCFQRAFPDHIYYSGSNIQDFAGCADIILTTEKDAVKLQRTLLLQGRLFAASYEVRPLSAEAEDTLWKCVEAKTIVETASPYSTCNSDSGG